MVWIRVSLKIFAVEMGPDYLQHHLLDFFCFEPQFSLLAWLRVEPGLHFVFVFTAKL